LTAVLPLLIKFVLVKLRLSLLESRTCTVLLRKSVSMKEAEKLKSASGITKKYMRLARSGSPELSVALRLVKVKLDDRLA